MTVSNLAVLAAVRNGAATVDDICAATGAARWWVSLVVNQLIRDRHLRRQAGRLAVAS